MKYRIKFKTVYCGHTRIIYDMSEETRIRENERILEKARHDEASQMAAARRRGEAEGEAIGEARGIAKGRAEGEVIGEARGIAKGRAEGEAIGEARGIAKGRAEERAKLLKQMRLCGISEDKIKMFEESLKKLYSN